MKKILIILFIVLISMVLSCVPTDDTEDTGNTSDTGDTTPTYTVNYNGNGNTSGNVPNDDTEYIEGATVTVLGNTEGLEKTDHAFIGWNTADDGNGEDYAEDDTFSMPGSDITLYAQWSPTYTISYDGNGNESGDVPTDDTEYIEGATVTVLGNTGSLEKTDHAFIGWNTADDGNGEDYAEDDTFSMPGSDITLYAQWSPTYTISYDGNGNVSGDVPTDSNGYIEGATVTVLGNTEGLEKTFYSFTGWNTSDDGNGDSYGPSDTFPMPAQDVTLYAQWIETVSYRDLVTVPGGEFRQESTTGEWFDHTISSFEMGQYEVTYELWHTVYQWAIDNDYSFSNAGREGHDGIVGADPTAESKYEPVTFINWRDAIVWCNAYSEMSGFTPVYYTDDTFTTIVNNSNFFSSENPDPDWSANGYRLPTEGEWQYAASYVNGADWLPNYRTSGDDVGGNTADYAWYSDNSDSSSHDVGTKQDNQLDIFDMSGNVYEPCWDWYFGYPNALSKTDYRGPSVGSNRIYRGGAWSSDETYQRVGNRATSDPEDEYNRFGIRVCRYDN